MTAVPVTRPRSSTEDSPATPLDASGCRYRSAPSRPDGRRPPEALGAGLAQLDRHLARCWGRAGIPAGRHDDCDQAVYPRLLERFGRDRFHDWLADAGRTGPRSLRGRETASGPPLLRAVDAVKKRTTRERRLSSLEETAVVPSPADGGPALLGRRAAVEEAIERSLDDGEAALVRAAMRGETPAEIAGRTGKAPKTISNEKAPAIRKLRLALADGDDGRALRTRRRGPRVMRQDDGIPGSAGLPRGHLLHLPPRHCQRCVRGPASSARRPAATASTRRGRGCAAP